jgi:hypothetical protein
LAKYPDALAREPLEDRGTLPPRRFSARSGHRGREALAAVIGGDKMILYGDGGEARSGSLIIGLRPKSASAPHDPRRIARDQEMLDNFKRSYHRYAICTSSRNPTPTSLRRRYIGGVVGERDDQKRFAVTLMARARMMALKKKPTTP